MFNTAILDVVIGLVFVYLLLSLMCSAANEMVEGWLKNRAADLERGLRELLKDPKGDGLVKKVYGHPLISGLFEGTYNPQEVGKLNRLFGKLKLPSYIPARTFALVLLDTALPAQNNQPGGTATSTPSVLTTAAESRNAFAKLRSGITSGIPNTEVQQALLSLVDAADNDVAKARENIEDWFDASMDRVSGWYKRRSQVFVFVLGLIVTVGVNADSVLIAKKLSADKVLRESLAATAQNYGKIVAEQSANASAAKPSQSPSENDAKPKASPSPAASPAASGAAPTTSPSPIATPSVSPKQSPLSSPSTSPETPPTTGNTEAEKTDCEKTPDTPECRYEKSLTQLKALSLPIGWVIDADAPKGQQWPGLHFWEGEFWSRWTEQFQAHLFGWLLTALAISLGAPFWFDLLNKFIVVRATVKPQEKSPEEKSKD